MKRLILILVIALTAGSASFAASANNESLEDIFSEFSEAKNAEYVNVNPFMMWLGKQFVGSDKDAQTVKKIKSVRVLDLEDCNSAVKSKFKNRVSNLALNGYEEMVRTNDNGEKVLVLAKMKKDVIHRMVIVCVSSDDCALVEVNGKFKMSDVTGVVNSQTPKHDGRR